MAIKTLAEKRRRIEDGMHGKVRPKKKVRKQQEYHSDSDEEPVGKAEQDPTVTGKAAKTTTKTTTGELPVLKKQPPKDKSSTTPEPRTKGKGKKENDSDSGETKDATGNDNESSGDEQEVDSPEEEEEEEEEEDEEGQANEEGWGTESESESESGGSGADDDDDEEEEENQNQREVPKRNDPSAFATSMSKILATKLPTSARVDPVLSRSRAVAQNTQELADKKLDKRVRAELRARKREELERGHVTDVLGVESGEAGETAELEKRLRKVAQRGVVKLFNAVRAAQVRGEELAREERRSRTTIGMGEREKHVNEISKQGFLDLINGDGKNKKTTIEEA